MGLCVGVYRLGGRGALLVDRLGVIGAHADAPGGDRVAARRLGQMRSIGGGSGGSDALLRGLGTGA